MKSANTLRELVEEIQFKKRWTIEKVAASIGYSRVHLSKEMKRPTSPLLKLLREKHNDILQNVSSNTEVNEPGMQYEIKDRENAQTVYKLVESNRLIAESNAKMAESNKILAKTNENLTEMVKRSTAGEIQETFGAFAAKMFALQEFLLEQSVKPKRYQSVAEADAVLSIKTNEYLKRMNEDGTRSGLDKKRR